MRSSPPSTIVASAFLVAVLALANSPASRAQQDVREALFMGSGPLTPSDGFPACPSFNEWSGFPRGTNVKVRVSTTVTENVRQAIQQALQQVPNATNGAISTSFELTNESNPVPNLNEVTLTFHSDPQSQGCPFSRGCIIHGFARPGVFVSGRAVQPADLPVNAYVHDVVGHGIMGLCHIDGNLIGGAGNSLMSGGPGVFSGDIAIQLTALDIEAAKTVYSWPLDPGAFRPEFEKFNQPDTTLPSLSITSPTASPNFTTTDRTVDLAGSASDNVVVTEVTWENDRGGSGAASGTTSWTANDIALLSGRNVITVTARDFAGNTQTDTITVTLTNNAWLNGAMHLLLSDD
jgi:hypothetical protein